MAITTQSGVPCKIRAGDTVVFEITGTPYSPSTHSAALLLNRNGTAAAPVAATESGEKYTFTLTAAITGALAPGTWEYSIRYTVTADGTLETGECGILTVLPNLAVNQTPSTAQSLLTLVEARLAEMTASGQTFTSFSFNGQSATVRSMGEMIAYRDSLRREVIREKQAAAQAIGRNDGTVFQHRFR